ncbi:sugar phosphate isomerase/epimerase [uncultured Acetatifactor sp.]|jgi:sugar phosphate isomerase/epimerase|uniref:sugar phosphate isomerase/epimerase family protein n=1 Tax=uncultured Acetatifactor sp. TaxID=1671927 RepID=UPI00262AEFA8|nr:sugar phosphate isomerase/epimerase [uncultured Acetatifactor sp.]
MKYDRISGFADEIAEDVDTQFRVLNKLDIRYFEPRGIDGKNIAELSDGEVAALKEKMERCGIKASSIGSPIGKIRLDEDFQAHFEKFQRVVDIAERLEAGYIRMFSFYPPERPDSAAGEGDGAAHEWTAGEREEVICRLRRMTAYAGERDVVLLHENEKGIYGDTAERCADLMRELGCRHFQAVFDPANFVQCGQDTKEAYEALRNFIAYVHVKDAREEDGNVVPAGAGDGNVGHILKGLLDSGYEGYLSLEPHLGSFSGLAGLELDDKMQNLPQGGEGTFTLAYRALEEILDKIIR